MRLIHAVLLPGVIVLISNGNLLQAHVVNGAEMERSARRFLRHDAWAAGGQVKVFNRLGLAR